MGFHPGELEIQQRAGVRAMADEVGESILDSVSDKVADFLQRRRFAVLGSVDTSHSAWASVVTGEPGFISVPNPRTVVLEGVPPSGDPLAENLLSESHAALLAIDLLNPRRVRVNGRAVIKDRTIYIDTAQVYGNCRRYIQERIILGARTKGSQNIEVTRSTYLSPVQCDQIARADTFFIATEHPDSGADVSHKGGNPGFVQVVDAGHLAIPDYNGNSMFNTLGNVAVNPKAGLLFINFESGRTLQISGVAAIDWSSVRIRSFSGAERVLDFEIQKVIDNSQGFPLTVKFRQRSRYNPQPG
jgi:uncharacterized protein